MRMTGTVLLDSFEFAALHKDRRFSELQICLNKMIKILLQVPEDGTKIKFYSDVLLLSFKSGSPRYKHCIYKTDIKNLQNFNIGR